MNRRISIVIDGNEVYSGKIENLPIKEEVLISESIELFGDDDPCIIHRSYIIKKILFQFIKEADSVKSGNSVNLSAISNETISKFDIENCSNGILTFIDTK